MRYTENKYIEEWGYDADSPLQYINYQTKLTTESDGIGLKAGTTYKVNDQLKVSLAYHSPVWWKISESTQEGITTEILDIDDLDGDGITDESFSLQLYPDIVNTFEPYRMTSPAKWLVGLSWVDKRFGFISLKYTRRDWRTIRLSALSDDPLSQDYFEALTQDVRAAYGIEQTLSVGGEWKVDKLMLRAGYETRQNPVKWTSLPNENKITFGLGYDFGAIDVDFGIVNGTAYSAYHILPVGLTNTYEVSTRSNQYVFTIKANF